MAPNAGHGLFKDDSSATRVPAGLPSTRFPTAGLIKLRLTYTVTKYLKQLWKAVYAVPTLPLLHPAHREGEVIGAVPAVKTEEKRDISKGIYDRLVSSRLNTGLRILNTYSALTSTQKDLVKSSPDGFALPSFTPQVAPFHFDKQAEFSRDHTACLVRDEKNSAQLLQPQLPAWTLKSFATHYCDSTGIYCHTCHFSSALATLGNYWQRRLQWSILIEGRESFAKITTGGWENEELAMASLWRLCPSNKDNRKSIAKMKGRNGLCGNMVNGFACSVAPVVVPDCSNTSTDNAMECKTLMHCDQIVVNGISVVDLAGKCNNNCDQVKVQVVDISPEADRLLESTATSTSIGMTPESMVAVRSRCDAVSGLNQLGDDELIVNKEHQHQKISENFSVYPELGQEPGLAISMFDLRSDDDDEIEVIDCDAGISEEADEDDGVSVLVDPTDSAKICPSNFKDNSKSVSLRITDVCGDQKQQALNEEPIPSPAAKRLSFFVCPLNIDSESDDDDDDDDDWDNPSTDDISCEGFSCISGLYIPPSPPNSDSSSQLSVSPTHCHQFDVKEFDENSHHSLDSNTDDGIVFSEDSISAENTEDDDDEKCSISHNEMEQRIIDANTKWNDMYPSPEQNENNSKQLVRFTSKEDQYIPVLNELLWADDYAKARIGPWRTIALDRARFQNRIKKLEQEISWTFCPLHRDRVYNLLHVMEPCEISARLTD